MTKAAIRMPMLIVAMLSFAAADADAAEGVPDIGHGRRVFQTCSSCHVADSATNRFGPSLQGVVGRPAAAVPDYRYSQAMREAAAKGLVWDDAALSQFLSSPSRKVPGTSMRFWGLWTQSEINDVIGYLKTNP